MNSLKLTALTAIAVVLSACAQQEEAPELRPQPVFDKFGGGSCEEGYVYVPGGPYQGECIPPDECEEAQTASAAALPCPPPGGRGEEDDDSTSGGNPTGSAPPIN